MEKPNEGGWELGVEVGGGSILQYMIAAACDISEGKFTLRAVIWCVDMVSINPEGVRMIKPCFVVLQGRILPLTLV